VNRYIPKTIYSIAVLYFYMKWMKLEIMLQAEGHCQEKLPFQRFQGDNLFETVGRGGGKNHQTCAIFIRYLLGDFQRCIIMPYMLKTL
jgi:hypothetical protein